MLERDYADEAAGHALQMIDETLVHARVVPACLSVHACCRPRVEMAGLVQMPAGAAEPAASLQGTARLSLLPPLRRMPWC